MALCWGRGLPVFCEHLCTSFKGLFGNGDSYSPHVQTFSSVPCSWPALRKSIYLSSSIAIPWLMYLQKTTLRYTEGSRIGNKLWILRSSPGMSYTLISGATENLLVCISEQDEITSCHSFYLFVPWEVFRPGTQQNDKIRKLFSDSIGFLCNTLKLVQVWPWPSSRNVHHSWENVTLKSMFPIVNLYLENE